LEASALGSLIAACPAWKRREKRLRMVIKAKKVKYSYSTKVYSGRNK